MAQLLKTNGDTENITGKNEDGSLTLDQMQGAVGGLIERAITLKNGKTVWVNEEGLMLDLPFNEKASLEAGMMLLGDALLTEPGEVK